MYGSLYKGHPTDMLTYTLRPLANFDETYLCVLQKSFILMLS